MEKITSPTQATNRAFYLYNEMLNYGWSEQGAKQQLYIYLQACKDSQAANFTFEHNFYEAMYCIYERYPNRFENIYRVTQQTLERLYDQKTRQTNTLIDQMINIIKKIA